MPFDPSMIMVSVAIASIDHKLNKIEKTGKDIISFLEMDKEASIEADCETLIFIMNRYKANWDNQLFIETNHKIVSDIQRSARQNIDFYQKEITRFLNNNSIVLSQMKLDGIYKKVLKLFKYYRLCLYQFSLGSFEELVLAGSFKSESIEYAVKEIIELSRKYREVYSNCSLFLEKKSKGSIESNVLKGVSAVTDTFEKFISDIPVVNMVDPYLQDTGKQLKDNVKSFENAFVSEFANVSNPEVSLIIEEMKEIDMIFSHTNKIAFDKENVYLFNDLQVN